MIYETKDFLTGQPLKIDTTKILEIQNRSISPWEKITHARVLIDWESWLVTISLDDSKELLSILEN